MKMKNQRSEAKSHSSNYLKFLTPYCLGHTKQFAGITYD